MRRGGINPVLLGGILLGVVVVVVYLGFKKDIPFVNEPYEIKAAFRDTSGMKKNSPVRIAGVEVGRVRRIEHTGEGSRTAVVTMSILDPGRPIHRDAHATIRPRIFLEGNFFVELEPGTPSGPEMKAGETIPVTRTENPVQFDEILKALRSDVRTQLKQTFAELGATEQAGGGRAFNDSLVDQPGAYRWTAVVSDALLGERPGDLGDLVRDTGIVAAGLDRAPERLRTLITDFDRTFAALAASESDLRASVRELPRTFRAAMPALADLNAAFPSVRRFARAARPGIRSTGPAARATVPLVRQLRGLVSEEELRGLTADLRVATPPLAALSRDTVPLLEQIRPLASCTSGVLVPFGNKRVPDQAFPASGPIYQETGKFLPGLAGESRSFDANGQWFKVLGQGGAETFDLGNGLFGTALEPILGVNPPPDRSLPPYRPDTPCETQEVPNLETRPGVPPRSVNTRSDSPAVRARTDAARAVALAMAQLDLAAKGDKTPVLDQNATAAQVRRSRGEPLMLRVIKKHWIHVAAVLGLMLIALAVSVYILGQQRVRFPWQDQTVRMYAEVETAQAVTPGQGQAVQIAGVKIGDIGKVELKDGRGRIALDVLPDNVGVIRTDAKAMLRPRTPLKDMYVQILPGTRDAPAAKPGHVIPVRNTSVDVGFDEFLSTFDERTRDYLTLLVEGTGKGLKGRGKDLAEVFRRYGPTVRDLRRVNEAVGQEDRALRRLVTSIADINGELARNPDDLAELVDASAATFTAFASEDDRLRETLDELPPTLRQASATLTDVRPFARELGPVTRALTPTVRALDDANGELAPFARRSTPIVRKELRPFARAARPLVSDLAPAARDLSAAIPEVTRSARVANRFFNMLASNPGGAEGPGNTSREEGFLFWLAWTVHQTVNLQNVEDANGPMRPIFLTGTCSSLTSLVNDNPGAEFGLNLSPVLATQCNNPNGLSADLAQLIEQLPAPIRDLIPVAPPGGRR